MVTPIESETGADDKAWWLPRWLDRIIPDLDVEGEHLIEALDHGDDPIGDHEEDGVAEPVPVPV